VWEEGAMESCIMKVSIEWPSIFDIKLPWTWVAKHATIYRGHQLCRIPNCGMQYVFKTVYGLMPARTKSFR
jgi:hypothetical protein